jgi:hypothetical protein
MKVVLKEYYKMDKGRSKEKDEISLADCSCLHRLCLLSV